VCLFGVEMVLPAGGEANQQRYDNGKQRADDRGDHVV
jgi:hypothetical protein